LTRMSQRPTNFSRTCPARRAAGKTHDKQSCDHAPHAGPSEKQAAAWSRVEWIRIRALAAGFVTDDT
jgi:hypothetical protein